MGFNVEQYELYDNDNYSNGSGKLKKFLGIGDGKVLGIGQGNVKKSLGIGDGKVLGIVINKDKNTQLGDEESSQDNKEIDNKNIASLSSTPEKSNTVMYIGIGASVLVIGVIAFLLIRRNK